MKSKTHYFKKTLIILLATGFALPLLISCNSISMRQPPIGVLADDQTLLSSLASMARTGRTAICDIEEIQKNLKIKIQPLSIPKERQQNYLFAGEITSADDFMTGEYFRKKINNKEICWAEIDYRDRKICDTKTNSFDKIIGQKREAGIPIPGRTTTAVFYLFTLSKSARSQINLGYSNANCTSTVSISFTEDFQ